MHRHSVLRAWSIGIAACLLGAAAHVPAMAQQPGNADDLTEVDAFTPTSVREILSSFGTAVTIADRQTPEGRTFVEASFGQLKINMFFTACPPEQPSQCQGLYLLAFWPKPAERNLINLTQAAGDFNRLYEFSKAGVSVAGEPFVARYLISDFGVKRGTLRREVTNFVVLAQRFNAEVVSPPTR
ncbi:YbjN domain-containing protein [Blastomonas sp.]|uniref:YbjN domain-containing protein n=1 Tax=Blastomonas sp. TaxID=1909299 RepID=UPI002632F7EF|nr:YbjN domain-containing protein [Blastomonas sp.]MDM7958030.1 YbjN domain-containing protein [Blastomonas sp.]